LTLSNPVNRQLGCDQPGDADHRGRRRAAAVQFSSAAYSVGEAAGTATITVTLSAPSGRAVTVDYATGDGTAAAPGDYWRRAGR